MSRKERNSGSSLVEVLAAIAILTVIMVGILQIFSLALVQGYGSAGRTQLMYKCQQVAEIIRMSQYLGLQGSTTFATTAGIPYPLTSIASTPPTTPAYQALPYVATDANYAFWGPSGANIVEKEKDAYRLFYSVERPQLPGLTTAQCPFNVRVSAYPVDSPNSPLPTPVPNPTPGQGRYLGMGSKLKVVEYVAQIPVP